jgi:tetratricopeptide (TPR) repeat protein
MSLSICFLTRDAEERIDRAVRSVIPLGAEVIVADTGSKDRTVEVARGLGAVTLNAGWADDFAAGQNAALDRATGDWVLWLNPDEEYLGPDRRLLALLLGNPEAQAYLIRVQEVHDPARPQAAVETWQPRLFRRHPAVRFVGRLQPQFSPPIDELARREGRSILRSDVIVRHHAYQNVLTEDKLRWATRLMELELRDRPGQLHYLIEYGRNLLRLNDPKGHDVLAEAAEQVLVKSEAPTAPIGNAASLLEYALTVSPEQSRTTLGPEQAGDLARRWFPNSPPLVWQLAQRAFQAGDYRESARLLEHLLHLGRTGTYDRFAAFDPALIGASAALNLGLCHLRLGDADRAEACFGQLLGDPKYQAQARKGYEAAQALRHPRP